MLKTYEVIATANAEITERWHVKAASPERAQEIVEGDPVDGEGEDLEFVAQINSEHESDREVTGVEEAAEVTTDVIPDNVQLWPFGFGVLMTGCSVIENPNDPSKRVGIYSVLAAPNDLAKDAGMEITPDLWREALDRGGPRLALTFKDSAAVRRMMRGLDTLANDLEATGCNAGQEHTPDEHGQCDDCRAHVEPDVQRMVIIVGVDSGEGSAGYGVVREQTIDEYDGDLFALLWVKTDVCDTFDTFEAAITHIAECDGKLVDVRGAVAY